jgi:hypothetical protein
MTTLRLAAISLVALAWAGPARAQQRPLVTEDPETIGAGRVLIEGGFDYSSDVLYTVSGLQGNLSRIPILGLSVGISSIAEIQFDAGPYDRLSITQRNDAPLADLVTETGNVTRDVDDIVIGTKIRLAPETGGRPSFGFRFATRLPNAGNESGLGLDTTDFYAALLTGKTIQSVRLVGNIGVGILADPTDGQRQNDVLTYGVSVARALTNAVELVGEFNGRASTREGGPLPGTESRGAFRIGARYTRGAARFDAGMLFGLYSPDPAWGFTVGATYVFNAFTLP